MRKKLCLEVQVETEMVITVVIVVMIVGPVGTMVGNMEVEVEMESALSVTGLGILRGSVLVKGLEEVGMGGGMTGTELVVINLEGTIGIVVLEEDQEMLL